MKKRGTRLAECSRRKLFLADHEIYESIEHRLKLKIRNIFVNEEIIEEYSVKIYEIDLFFSNNYIKNTS